MNTRVRILTGQYRGYIGTMDKAGVIMLSLFGRTITLPSNSENYLTFEQSTEVERRREREYNKGLKAYFAMQDKAWR